MNLQVARKEILEAVDNAGLEWGDQEVAEDVVDIMLEAFNPIEIYSWLAFPDEDLGGIPVSLISEGRSQDVVKQARAMVVVRSSA